LFFRGLITANVFAKMIGDIFKILQKKRHVRFLFFVKELFKLLVLKLKRRGGVLAGLRLRINGKLRGKARSSTCCICSGQVPAQTLGKAIDYAKLHVFTVYGVFGIRLWVNKRLAHVK